MENLKEKINKYINNKGLLKTPVHYVKELLIGIIDKIDDTVDKVEDVVEGSIELINETLKETINTTIELNIIPYVRNKIVFDTEELNIDTKNGYYYNDNILENLKITKLDDTICPKVEFNGYYIKLQLPKGVALQNKFVNFDGFAKYIINFDNNNCKIDKYKNDVSNYLVVTYSEGTTDLSYYGSKVFASLDRKYINNVGPVYENERLITDVGTTTDENLFYWCEELTSVLIPNSVTSIGNYTFYGCTGLTSITIPNSVTSVGSLAFRNCTGLTSITIPNSVTSIGYYAFEYCPGLTSITIPNSVTSIEDGAFSYCPGLTSIIVDESNSIYDSRQNCNAIIKTKTNTLISGCKNTIILDSVTDIGNSAFEGCSGLTSVEIPNSVTSIGYSAFGGCSGLTSVEIPNSVTSIENWAFSDCTGLTSIIVDENNPIYDSRENCNAIIKTESNTLISGCKNTIIPDSVTSIGESAFNGCSGLTSITIPNSVTSISRFAFSGSGLTSITIPDLVTSIGESVFSDCSGLTSVEIPNSVTSISRFAFSDCSGLISIVIPDLVTSIGECAFFGCSGLTSITIFSIDPPTLGSSVFYSTPSNLIIYVPDESVDAYKTKWSSYSSKIKPISEKPV